MSEIENTPENNNNDEFGNHLQNTKNIINFLDGLQMGEIGVFDNGDNIQNLMNNFIVLNDNQSKLELLLKNLSDLQEELQSIKSVGIAGPAGPAGKDGQNGVPGRDGKDGAPGKDLLFNNLSEIDKVSLKGNDGAPGPAGRNGKDGKDGKDGAPFVYEMFTAQQLAALIGPSGINGKDGFNGKDGKDGKDGRDGVDGISAGDGKDGRDGRDGVDGKSAYELAQEFGNYVGDINEWLLSLKGTNGTNDTNGRDGKDGFNGINGVDGKDGADGKALIWSDLTAEEKLSIKGNDGVGIKAGGNVGQVLTKASELDFDVIWKDSTFNKKTYKGTIAPNTFKEIITEVLAHNIMVDVKVKDNISGSTTYGYYINASNLSTVAIIDNKIRIFNEYSTNLEFLITTSVLNDSDIIAI